MSGRSRAVVLLLTVALVAALVGLGLSWRAYDEQRDLAEAGREAEAAARAAVTSMTTYDHETVEEDFAWVEEAGTQDFQQFFAESSSRARELITAVRASAQGEVVASAANVVSTDEVEVLLFVDQRITSAGEEGTRLDQPRVTMHMVRRDGRWLVDRLQVNNLLTEDD